MPKTHETEVAPGLEVSAEKRSGTALAVVSDLISFDKNMHPYIPLERALFVLAPAVPDAQRIVAVTRALEYLVSALQRKQITPRTFRSLLKDLVSIDISPDLSIVSAALAAIDDLETVAAALPANLMITLGCFDIEFCSEARLLAYLRHYAQQLSKTLFQIESAQKPSEVLESTRIQWVEILGDILEHISQRVADRGQESSIESFAYGLAKDGRVAEYMIKALTFLAEENNDFARQILEQLDLDN